MDSKLEMHTYYKNHVEFNIIAVGPNSACTLPHDTSLEDIAIDTGGDCMGFFNVLYLLGVMKYLTDV